MANPSRPGIGGRSKGLRVVTSGLPISVIVLVKLTVLVYLLQRSYFSLGRITDDWLHLYYRHESYYLPNTSVAKGRQWRPRHIQ
jgi:hypothetical protein